MKLNDGKKTASYWPPRKRRQFTKALYRPLLDYHDDDIEDVTQAVSVVIVESVKSGKAANGEAINDWGRYAYGTAKNFANDIIRRRTTVCDGSLHRFIPHDAIKLALKRYKESERESATTVSRQVRRLLWWQYGLQLIQPTPDRLHWWAAPADWPEALTRVIRIDEPKTDVILLPPESKIISGHYQVPQLSGRTTSNDDIVIDLESEVLKAVRFTLEEHTTNAGELKDTDTSRSASDLREFYSKVGRASVERLDNLIDWREVVTKYLTDEQARVMRCLYDFGLTYPEASACLGSMPITTIKRRENEAISQLHACAPASLEEWPTKYSRYRGFSQKQVGDSAEWRYSVAKPSCTCGGGGRLVLNLWAGTSVFPTASLVSTKLDCECIRVQELRNALPHCECGKLARYAGSSVCETCLTDDLLLVEGVFGGRAIELNLSQRCAA